ncbi:MAG: hypothetical protein U5L75_01840 [Candidatus Campbellbacteria bacterium]|nr:hypothetical protein [Candidatus Campbellbacteria bacterium]
MRNGIKRHVISYLAIGLAAFALLFFIAPQNVRATSDPPPMVTIEAELNDNLFTLKRTCLDQNCFFVLEEDQTGDFSIKRAHDKEDEFSILTRGSVSRENNRIRIQPDPYSIRYKDVPFREDALVEALKVLIQDDISDIKPVLLQTFEGWARVGRGASFTVTPYEPSKERELQKDKNRLLECFFNEYERKGDWLIISEGNTREYCYPDGNFSRSINYSHFTYFLLTNIHQLPTYIGQLPIFHLVILILILLGVVGFMYHLIRKGNFWLFLKPNKTKVILVVVSGIILTVIFAAKYMQPGPAMSVVIGARIIDYLIQIYLLICVIGYVIYKLKNRRETN